MKQTLGTSKDAAGKLVRGIKRKTRKRYSAEEKIWIVRRQSLSDVLGCIVTEALVRFRFKFRQQRLGAASGVV